MISKTQNLYACAVIVLVLTGIGPALAVCKTVTVRAAGVQNADIEAATASAGDALVAKIVAAYGKTWTMGGHRNGSFHCDRILAGRNSGWTCTAKTTAICAPSHE
jgi:hypothetical protein